MTTAVELARRAEELFRGEPRIFRAPGRVNLIGEHTDYNDGFVMPAAVELSTWVAVVPRKDRKLLLQSEDLSATREFDLDDPASRPGGDWSDYVRGVALALGASGRFLRGAGLFIRSELPLGVGLASSAALEVASGLALLANSGVVAGRVELAKLCQRAENDFVGARCGIMDQFISCCALAGHALLLDCRSLDSRLLPLPADLRLVICNSMIEHRVSSGEYNARRLECEELVRCLSPLVPGLQTLRDLTLEELDRCRGSLAETLFRRARHVVTENSRVLDAARALESGDAPAFGRLMGESHRSLRDDYQVSCLELDTLVDLASKAEGVIGGRMTGAGFGGCTVNLVRVACVESFRQSVSLGYERATGRKPEIYVCSAAEGAGEVLPAKTERIAP
jgi:galactokinase